MVLLFVSAASIALSDVRADENLLGYVRGAEPLPKKAWELYEKITARIGKGSGDYQAFDAITELEYGFTDRFSGRIAFGAMAIESEGLIIDGYLPKDVDFGPKMAGMEAALKYNFLTPAKDPVGLAMDFAVSWGWLDPHSGQDKNTLSIEQRLLLQKYWLDGQLIFLANVGYEATHAQRYPIGDLPPGFDWPTTAEMEIGLEAGLGLSYRFARGWFVGLETIYENEYETEVDMERWTWFGGPSIHYGSKRWWLTATWITQFSGGGEAYPGQPDTDLHLIEKTENEYRLKVGFNF
jgi:hypothetical protein